MSFLHTFHPQPILFSFGLIQVYWYGFFVVLAILAGVFIAAQLAKQYKQAGHASISTNEILDLAFFLIIGGLLGARIYDVFLEFPYYIENPINVFKIWQGGLAIHGGIIGGLLALGLFVKRKYKKENQKEKFIFLASLLAPALAAGQAIGRWGNYFNQELFGRPTSLPWGIPISLENRPLEYLDQIYFHPAFLYESIGSLLIFGILLALHFKIIKKKKENNLSFVICHLSFTAVYLALYSALRFSVELIRIDYAPVFLGLRAPQLVSIVILVIIGILFFTKNLKTSTSPCHSHESENPE